MKVLIVDDEEVNLDILDDYLVDEGFDTVKATDGMLAWDALLENEDIALILLDRMMPKHGGMELMDRIKANSQFKDIPVIMQTAAADPSSIVEGVNAGVYYYLTKPFKRSVLLAIVNAALNDRSYMKEIVEEVNKSKDTLGLLQKASFELKTINEAQNMAFFLANSSPDPEKVVLGLSEVLINAVEHGNLQIGYEEKGRLMLEGDLPDEINRRAKLPENINKVVKVNFERQDDEIEITVTDEGEGFDWPIYLEMDPERASKPNGRGIMMAKQISFDDLQFKGAGNEVVCKISLKDVKQNVA